MTGNVSSTNAAETLHTGKQNQRNLMLCKKESGETANDRKMLQSNCYRQAVCTLILTTFSV